MPARRNGNHRARLDRSADQAIVAKLDLDHMRGAGECGRDGLRVTARPAKADVAWRCLVQLRRAGCGCRVNVDQRREGLVLHMHHLCGIGRRRGILGKHGCDRLTHMPDHVARQGIARRFGHR